MVVKKNMLIEIQSRYTEESGKNCNLSCGSNLGFLKIIPGEKILDLGCGRGNDTIQAAILAGPEGKAVGLDITMAMIDIAHANSENAGVGNAWFVKGNIEELPFGEAVFDAVMSNCVINHAGSKEKVFNEIYRVLKPGGRFVISDAVTKNPLPPEVKNSPEAWAQCFGGAITEKEYLKSIRGAGFCGIQILGRREYMKNGFEFASLTIKAEKKQPYGCHGCKEHEDLFKGGEIK